MAAQTLQTEPAPLTPGDRVVVYRTRELEDVPESADIIEGEATLSSRLTEDATGELWEVRFDGEPGAYVRWVTLEDRVTLAGRQP